LYQKETLDNGLKVITSAMPQTHSVSICIYLGVGSRYESDAIGGVSHFLEHLCFRGTEKRPSAKDISEAIEGVGGILNGGTDKELTVYWCKVASPHFPLALDVLSDMVLNSRFEPNDIERERKVIIEEISMSRDSPNQLVGVLIDELLWPNHPLGRDVAGTRDSVGNISRNSMLDFLAQEYSPQNTVISIAGNIEHKGAVEQVRQHFECWKSNKQSINFDVYEEKINPRLKLENRQTEQTHLCIALPGISLMDPRRFPLDLLNVILGEGMSSRLFQEVRDKLGLAYNVHSYLDHFHDCGALTVYAGVKPENLRVCIEAIVRQMTALKNPVPKEELIKAKELSKGRLMLRMEDSRSVAGWTGGQEILEGHVMTVEEAIEKIDAITAEDMSEAASELFIGSKLRLSVVGPVTEDGLTDLLVL
jgi:predicted Zn-dependent peptidase